jgi:hypothetical protein
MISRRAAISLRRIAQLGSFLALFDDRTFSVPLIAGFAGFDCDQLPARQAAAARALRAARLPRLRVE